MRILFHTRRPSEMKYRCKNCKKNFWAESLPCECPWCGFVKIPGERFVTREASRD